MKQHVISCHFCGRDAEPAGGQAPCEVLNGWITVSFWKGKGVVEHLNFCSMNCLHQSLLSRMTAVPNVFLKSFGEADWDESR